MWVYVHPSPNTHTHTHFSMWVLLTQVRSGCDVILPDKKFRGILRTHEGRTNEYLLISLYFIFQRN